MKTKTEERRKRKRSRRQGECTHFPCIGSHIQATGWPDRLTAPICPGRWSSIWMLRFQKRTVKMGTKRKRRQQWWGLKFWKLRSGSGSKKQNNKYARYTQIWFLREPQRQNQADKGMRRVDNKEDENEIKRRDWRVGNGDDFGFSFENGSRFEKNNNVEDRKRGAPFERRICWWGSLFQVLYRGLRLRQTNISVHHWDQ